MTGIAYFVNHYPAPSHSFIREEIAAIERLGQPIARFALRGWDAALVDPRDEAERMKTQYLVKNAAGSLFLALIVMLFSRPLRLLRTVAEMLRNWWDGDRSLFSYLSYVAGACLLVRLCERDGIRHVHAHFGTNSADVVRYAQRLGGPTYSLTVHGPEEFDHPRALSLPAKIAESRFTVGVSSFGRSQMLRLLSSDLWSKVHVVHCGLGAAYLNAPISPVPDVPLFLSVGRFCEQKGQMILIDSVRILHERGLSCRVRMIGDGGMRGVIERRIADHGLADSFELLGFQGSDAIRASLDQSRAMVLPSFAEGLPVVIMEAMAMGRPVISTYVAGIPELVRDGIDGWLVPAGSPVDLADAMQACLRADQVTLDGIGSGARARVGLRHSADTEAGKLLALFSA